MTTRSKTTRRVGKASPRKYLLVFLMLAILTALEVYVAQAFQASKVPFLLGMSFIKAMLVILYFMHLRYDSRWFAAMFFLPFLLIVPLLLVLPH